MPNFNKLVDVIRRFKIITLAKPVKIQVLVFWQSRLFKQNRWANKISTATRVPKSNIAFFNLTSVKLTIQTYPHTYILEYYIKVSFIKVKIVLISMTTSYINYKHKIYLIC